MAQPLKYACGEKRLHLLLDGDIGYVYNLTYYCGMGFMYVKISQICLFYSDDRLEGHVVSGNILTRVPCMMQF